LVFQKKIFQGEEPAHSSNQKRREFVSSGAEEEAGVSQKTPLRAVAQPKEFRPIARGEKKGPHRI